MNKKIKKALHHYQSQKISESSEIEKYFYEKYRNANFRVVPGNWPKFETKEEIDKWIE
jgi:hypothetical protein